MKEQSMKEHPMKEQPMFTIYKRRYLSDVTGYSVGYLCRIATGHQLLSRSFIERVCYKLNRPEEELFLPNSAETCNKPQ